MSDEHSHINDKTRNNTHNKSFIKRFIKYDTGLQKKFLLIPC